MDSEPDRELEMIRADAHQTRAALANKLEALESQVSQTVAGVTSAVETVSETVSGVTDAVSNVSQSVTDTVEKVKVQVADTVTALDPTPMLQKAPWTAVGCAFATGVAAGYFSGGARGSNGHAVGAPVPAEPKTFATNGHTQHYQEPGVVGSMTDTLGELGGSVRSLGISALMGVVAHLAKNAVPEAMKQDVSTALDKLKTRLGGHHNVNPETFLGK